MADGLKTRIEEKMEEVKTGIEAKMDEKLDELQETINSVEVPPCIPDAATELSASDIAVAADNVTDYIDSEEAKMEEMKTAVGAKIDEKLDELQETIDRVDAPPCIPGAMDQINAADVEVVANAVKESLES